MSLLFFQIIFIIIFSVKQYACQDQVNFVYNSIPYKSIDVQNRNGSSKNIKVASQAGIVVVAVGNAGVMIIDKNFNSYIYESPDKNYIECVQITKDAKYVFSGMKEKVGVFELDQTTYKINLINTIQMKDAVIVDVQFNLQEEVMFVMGYLGILHWYDSRDMKNIKKLGEVVYEQMMFMKSMISPDNKFFYIAADQDGLLAFKIEEEINDTNLQVNLTRILRKQAVSSFIELVITNKNEYMFAIDRWNGIYLLHKLTNLIVDGQDIESKNIGKQFLYIPSLLNKWPVIGLG